MLRSPPRRIGHVPAAMSSRLLLPILSQSRQIYQGEGHRQRIIQFFKQARYTDERNRSSFALLAFNSLF
jgi:hypothetical protein